MKTTAKQFITLALAVVLLISALPLAAFAASNTAFGCLSETKYAKTFMLSTSGKTIPYTNSNLTTRGTVTYGASSSSYIDNASDEVYLMDAGVTNGVYWGLVSYPSGNRRVIAYIPLSAITANNDSNAKTTSSGKFYCAPRRGASVSNKYYVDNGDPVYLVASSDGMKQILYPSGSVFRLAWCTEADYTKYCGGNPTTSSGNTTSGNDMVDVTKNFAGKTITLKSVENGKYLCADSDRSNTPAVCDRSNVSTWEKVIVSSMTSDGWVGFQSANNGKWLSAVISTTDGPIRASASKLQSWECFRIYKKGNDYYIKAQANNKWLCVRVDKSGAPVQAYASSPSTWERFSISICDSMSISSTGAKYTYVTKTLDVSSLSNWTTSVLKAQDNVNGMIVSISVKETRAMQITEPVAGPPVNGKSPTKTTTIQAPYKVTFKLHTHERETGFGASWRYENGCIVTMNKCACGKVEDLLVWEIPLPDPSEFYGKQINQTINMQAQHYVWLNNLK